jgi:peptidoglycan/xylan/chitin deacetylase (PgdA/CDA1 family)
MSKRYCLLSNDVECHSIWFNTVRPETGEKILTEGMPLLLDIYQKYDIRCTFFFTTYIAERFPDVVRMAARHGHEVGSHGYSHEVGQSFDVLPFDTQVQKLKQSKNLLEELSGQEVISFRAPALRVNGQTPLALAEAGFGIDSSVASQRFDMFLSFGGMRKLKWLTAPRRPYRTRRDSLFRQGDGPIVEVPLSALLFPYVGTTMRLFPLLTKIQHHLLDAETRINQKPIVFDIHPNEMIEEGTGQRVIKRRSSNIFSYLWGDWLRGKLKVKNLGSPAVPLYEREIRFFRRKNYAFLPIKEYCKEVGLRA